MNEPLAVAIDMTFPNRNAAGSGVYAKELLRQFTDRERVKVSGVSAGVDRGMLGTAGWLAGGARRAVAQAGAQVVHCPAFVAPWRLDIPLVLTVHDTAIKKFPDDHPLEWRTYIRLFLAQRARSAVRVITGTEFSRSEIVSDLGVLPERIVVTPYGVAERFTGQAVRTGPVGDQPLLLFPGAPTRRKNLGVVLEAMAQAPSESALRRARLVISGAEADTFPKLRAKIEALGLKPRVSWRGRVALEKMPALVRSMDLVVYPSLHEGFGFPALEAMASGTPVVASTAACLPEVLGDAALLVDPTDVRAFGDAVEAVLTKPHLRCELIDKGRARAARFTWRRCADLTIEVYLDAAASAGRT